jgi:hypothetical protein
MPAAASDGASRGTTLLSTETPAACHQADCGPNFAAHFKVIADAGSMRTLSIKVCKNGICAAAEVGSTLEHWPSWESRLVVTARPLIVEFRDYANKTRSCEPSCDVELIYSSDSTDADVYDVAFTAADTPVTPSLHGVAHYSAREINGPGCGLCFRYELNAGDAPIVLRHRVDPPR